MPKPPKPPRPPKPPPLPAGLLFVTAKGQVYVTENHRLPYITG